MGLLGLPIQFLKAGFNSAASAIILNGIPTESFELKRSVRQGCPLSPRLLFILAFDLLSVLLQRALLIGTIKGVEFPETGVNSLHNFFADDTCAVICDLMESIREFQRILIWFGNAYGLKLAWEDTVLACIPAGPPPLVLGLLPWKWEDNSTPTPLLGVPIAESIAQERIEISLTQKLKSRITKFEMHHLSLPARITIANSLILGCLWYVLIMWHGQGKIDFSRNSNI